MSAEFRKELADLINMHGKDVEHSTPDHVLADFLADVMLMYGESMRDRERWFGRLWKEDQILER